MKIHLTRRDELAIITIDAPPLNLYSLDLDAEFHEALDELGDARALLVNATGKVVSGGVDVSLFAAQEYREEAQQLFDRMILLPQRLAALPMPTVFAAHALCLTWAFELAVACDLLVSSTSARFGLVEKVVGLTPTMGGTQRLAARAGVARAKEFVMTGDLYDAATLERWNVVNRVFPDDGFALAAEEFALGLAVGPTRAHAATKEVLAHYEHGGVAAADAHVTTIASGLYESEDLPRAVHSFLTDGPGRAHFTGR
ncbi:enoyl-CoA hydratase/isomerase family protein [Lentzea sp. NPDC058436]|uniref:enoyl-CoA hydratase/isomerase family protein n=1 Tax=Lentzea sp. NPDC058436 TaxID=3346499 RepID=UPI003654FFD2